MIEHKNVERYYALDRNNKYVEFNSKWELLNFLLKFYNNREFVEGHRLSWRPLFIQREGKEVLRGIGNNFNDVFYPGRYGCNCQPAPTCYYSTEYVIFDSLWRIVNTSLLLDELKSFDAEKYWNNRPVKKYPKFSKRRWSAADHSWIFRRTPMPGIHAYKTYRHFYRQIRYFPAMKESTHYPEFNRLSRSVHNLPDIWDDYTISKAKIHGWKRTKKTKQWMKGKNSERVIDKVATTFEIFEEWMNSD